MSFLNWPKSQLERIRQEVKNGGIPHNSWHGLSFELGMPTEAVKSKAEEIKIKEEVSNIAWRARNRMTGGLPKRNDKMFLKEEDIIMKEIV